MAMPGAMERANRIMDNKLKEEMGEKCEVRSESCEVRGAKSPLEIILKDKDSLHCCLFLFAVKLFQSIFKLYAPTSIFLTPNFLFLIPRDIICAAFWRKSSINQMEANQYGYRKGYIPGRAGTAGT